MVCTWGYSSRVSLWNCRTSLVRPYVGSYVQSFDRVLFCKICNKLPYCISYYENHFARVWDFRTLENIQLISLQHILSSMTSLFILNNDDLLFGNKDIYLYANDEKEFLKLKQVNQAPPFQVQFNPYHKTIVCVAK